MENEIAIDLVTNTPANIELLQKLSVKTFIEAFGADNTAANMKSYLDECLSYKKLAEEISNADTQFYFAKNANHVIGYLKINTGKAQTELPDGNGLEVERIYILQEFQGKKVGQLLFDKAMQVARIFELDYLWLGVWENNRKAIQFYEKNGLVQFGTHTFMLGDDVQTDVMMKIDLS